jgi:hypothetical protein
MDEPQQTVGATDIAPADRDRPGSPARQQSALLRYFGILWRHKLLVVAGSLPPALLLALAIHLMPVRYATTLRHKRPLPDNEYRALLEKFYDSGNLGKIATRLREKGITDYATKLEKAKARRSRERLIRFRVSSARPKPANTSDPTVSQRPDPLEPRLLDVTITGRAQDDMPGIAEAVAENLVSVLPSSDMQDNGHTRLADKPIVNPVPKRILQRSTLALLVLLMATTFLAVSIEYRKDRYHNPGATRSC